MSVIYGPRTESAVAHVEADNTAREAVKVRCGPNQATVCLNCTLPTCDEDHDPRCPFFQTWHRVNAARVNELQRALRQKRKEATCSSG
jgi:hypothetical protein